MEHVDRLRPPHRQSTRNPQRTDGRFVHPSELGETFPVSGSVGGSVAEVSNRVGSGTVAGNPWYSPANTS